jgi:hypothetical protein
MKFQNTISNELKDILKCCTTVPERIKIAEKHNISIHTLNSVLEGKRNITYNNHDAILELLAQAISNAKSFHMSLIDYFHETKYIKFI